MSMNRHERRRRVPQEVAVRVVMKLQVLRHASGEAMVLDCGPHDSLPWCGTVTCPACHRCYQTESDEKPNFCPEDCPCGVQLLTEVGSRLVTSEGAPVEDQDRALACCTRCFEVALAHGGRHPSAGSN
jgi:hypothetical protein